MTAPSSKPSSDDWPKDLAMTPPASKNPSPSKGLARAMEPSQEELRDFLLKLVVYGDDKGWVEYTDGGVWVTDKAISAINSLTLKQVLALIGEDEQQQHSGGISSPEYVQYRNGFREQLRQSAERIWS